MVNTMLCKILAIQLTNPYFTVTDDKHHCNLSGGLYPVQEINNCAIGLYFSDDSVIKTHLYYCKYYLKNLNKLPRPNHYLTTII